MLALAPLPFRASKRFTLDGVDVSPGDVVDLSGLPPTRVKNMEGCGYGLRVAAEFEPQQQIAPPGDAEPPRSVDLPSPDLGAAPTLEVVPDLDEGGHGARVVDASDLLDVGPEVQIKQPAPATRKGKERSPRTARAGKG